MIILCFVLVGQLEAAFTVDLCPVGGFCLAQDRQEPAEALDEVFDLLPGESGL